MQSTDVGSPSSPSGGRTRNIWIVDVTPPTLIHKNTEALSENTIETTLQLDVPGTVWCQPVLPSISPSSSKLKADHLTAANYEVYIKGDSTRGTYNSRDVHVPYNNVVVSMNMIEDASRTSSSSLVAEETYHIFCYAEDTWDLVTSDTVNYPHSPNYATGAVANKVPFSSTQNYSAAVGDLTMLDFTPPTITITSASTTETSITVVLQLNEPGTAWCRCILDGYSGPSGVEIRELGYSVNVPSASTDVTIVINSLDVIGNVLTRGTDYDVYCYAEDDLCLACLTTNVVNESVIQQTKADIESLVTQVRTLDQTPPSMTLIGAETLTNSQVQVTLQVDEGARVYCAAFDADPGFGSSTYRAGITSQNLTCMNMQKTSCGSFWVYDLDDLEDGAADGVTSQNDYDSALHRVNENLEILLTE